MIRGRYLAIDETVKPGDTYSSTDLNEELGFYDALAVHLVVDNIQGGGSIYVNLEHSGDGILFKLKSNIIPSTVLPAGGVLNDQYGSSGSPLVDGGDPMLRFVRFQVHVSVSTAHVKLYVFARDPTG